MPDAEADLVPDLETDAVDMMVPDIDCADVTVVDLEGPIDAPLTLSGVNGCDDYRMSGTLEVNAALTIEPGVSIVCEAAARADVNSGGSANTEGDVDLQ